MTEWQTQVEMERGDRFTLEKFHHQIIEARFLPDVVKDTDVRMFQLIS